jgi:hypothetical protein
MSPDPFIATDNIQFTLTLDIDRCLLTTIDDQFLPDQTYKIDMNSPPTSLTYREFEDWVTRDQAASPPHVCGPRKYELSTIAGGGSSGKFLQAGLSPAVPNIIKFRNNDPA